MPPRKAAKPATPAAPLPPPNSSHPCYALLATSTGDLPARPHTPRSHVFFRPLSGRAAAAPPKKKQKKTDELPPASDGAWDAARIQSKLLRWFDARRGERTMPWRKDGVPSDMTRKERSQRGYEVWVSEIMLQQTQVATVVSYYKRWIATFPTVVALSEASVDDVNAIWTGLGYYSRAKRLLEGAQTVVRDFGGLVPEAVEDLLKIEGIGPYSAGAISSIAFGKRSALVDGNVTRVLSRLTALHAPATAKSTTSFIWALADLLVPEQRDAGASGDDEVEIKNRPGSWNQGLMELGATVCTPKNPKCGECPISEECLGYQEARFIAHRPKVSTSPRNEVDMEDLCTLCSPLPLASDSAKDHSVEIYPMAKERKKQREEETAVCLVEWAPSSSEARSDGSASAKEGRKILVMKRPEKGLLAGLLEFPSVDIPPPADSTLSTASARSKHLSNLLRTLIDLPPTFDLARTGPSAAASSNGSLPTQGRVAIESTAAFEPIVHVYSHMIRTYHTIHLVLTCPSLPKLLACSATADSSTSTSKKKKKKPQPKRNRNDDDDDDDDASAASEGASHEGGDAVVQSRAGTGKWIDEDQVEGGSLGGAMKKVWELRQDVASGRHATVKKSAKAGKRLGDKAAPRVEKGQKTLAGFFGGAGVPKTKKEAVDNDSQKGNDGEDGEVIIIEQETETKVTLTQPRGRTIVESEVEEISKKVYKKRRIAPLSDEDDEE
ncbi:hypothetical protein JCM11491_006223 [Sporobolomyces phaffii]